MTKHMVKQLRKYYYSKHYDVLTKEESSSDENVTSHVYVQSPKMLFLKRVLLLINRQTFQRTLYHFFII